MKTEFDLVDIRDTDHLEHSGINNLKFMNLTPEGIQNAAFLFDTCHEMSLKEVREMTRKKMDGIQIADVIRQDRDAGW